MSINGGGYKGLIMPAGAECKELTIPAGGKALIISTWGKGLMIPARGKALIISTWGKGLMIMEGCKGLMITLHVKGMCS